MPECVKSYTAQTNKLVFLSATAYCAFIKKTTWQKWKKRDRIILHYDSQIKVARLTCPKFQLVKSENCGLILFRSQNRFTDINFEIYRLDLRFFFDWARDFKRTT